MSKTFKRILSITIILSLISFTSLVNILVRPAYAGLLSTAGIQMSDSRPSQTGVTYTTTFTPSGTTSIRCIKLDFKAAPDMTGASPSGFMTNVAAKGSFTNLTAGSWTIDNDNDDGTIFYTNAAGEATVTSPTVVETTLIDNTSVSTFYAQVSTYTNINCSTGPVDQSNVMALVTVPGVATTVTVEPTLTFTVSDYGSAVNGSGDTSPKTTTSTTIPFGSIAAGGTSWGSQTLTVTTNAANGYSIYVRDTQSLTNINSDTIRNQAGTPGAPQDFDGSGAQSSFGYTVDGTSAVVMGSNKWAGLTQSNVQIATRNSPVSPEDTNIELKVTVSDIQEPGTYSTVIAYTATPSY